MRAPGKERRAGRRGAARLAAVQALYEMDIAGAKADPVLVEFMQSRWKSAAEDGDAPPPDVYFLGVLVRGVDGRLAESDAMIGDALSDGRLIDCPGAALRAVRSAGAGEAAARAAAERAPK